MDTLIELENVTYIYPDGSVGVEDVTLSVAEGERVALIGANGSGKSTLILLMAALLKPTRGKVRVFGNRLSVEQLRRKIGVVFQNPDDFLFNPTVKDELEYVPRQLGWSEREIAEKVERIAKLFAIENVLEKPPFRLSGGEKKKVELASVLIYEPEVLLLDEPTANVDGRTRRLLVKILSDYDGTVVIATHELDVAERLADRFVILNSRRIFAVGGREVLDKKTLEEAGII
ncbi:MAG: ABC transporter ATP-binding protein [Archaeoglobaceae archaeon]